ncbi:forkhead box protein B2-like [Musca vetustissima]|uniref:forkhead box protein B2-like n=1 Tax=Musca vetustissima TaxID=27455 RepID=UPI002AB685CA|nr:forkhead box protein B2-like [Musca vetustissima]
MSQQHQPRKHYHIHAPYPHHPPPVPTHHTHAHQPGHPPPPPSSSSHHVAAQQHQQQQQHQQWYNAHSAATIPPPQAQPPPPQYHHGLHIRDSRHLQQQHHHPHHPPQHGHAMPAPPPPPPTHMFTSGYASGMPVGVGGGAGGPSSTHNTASSMPASGSSSSSSSSASAQHFSALGGGVGGVPNVGASGSSVITGSGPGTGGGVIVGRSRVYDLEMVNTQHGGGVGAPSSMLAIGGARGAAYDAYSHSSLYSQQQQPPPTPTSQRHHLQQQQQHKKFKRGRTTIEDGPRSGRPKRATTTEIVAKVHDVVFNDRRIKVREIPNIMGISNDRAHSILYEELQMKKISKTKSCLSRISVPENLGPCPFGVIVISVVHDV